MLAELIRPTQSVCKDFHSVQLDASAINSLNSIVLASQCLYLLGQYDDCIYLLNEITFLDEDSGVIEESIRVLRTIDTVTIVSPLSAIYCIMGKSLDLLDNRSKSVRSLVISIELDPACTESVEYLIQNSMLSELEKLSVYKNVEKQLHGDRKWILPLYSNLLKLSASPPELINDAVLSARTAEHYYQLGILEDSYRFSRYAFTLDPYNTLSIATYIASMVELKQSTELFYLSHELIKSHPRQAMSWYAIGCYYWIINKYIAASKYFQKSVKVDKRFVQSWIMLGHTLSAQEESEHAISAYRTAVRLLPNDHKPAVCMAKELLKANYTTLALQVLLGCYESQPSDQLLLNEIGVAYMKVDQPLVAIDYFEKSIFSYRSSSAYNTQNKLFESSVSCYLCRHFVNCFTSSCVIMRRRCESVTSLKTHCFGMKSVYQWIL